MLLLKKILVLSLLLLTLEVNATLNIRARAREHFIETHTVQIGSEKATYSGLSNTLNIWHEIPFKYSLGFSISPILGTSKPKNDPHIELGSSFQLKVYGLEFKYFPLEHNKFFVRTGAALSELQTKGLLGTLSGSSYYLGVGYEIPFYAIHLAPEIAYRISEFEKRVSVKTFNFALGFHFYKHF